MKIKGAGTIRKISKYSWEIRFSLGYDKKAKKYRQATRTVKGTKADAVRAREEFRRELEGGLRLDADKVTFGEYAAQWHETRISSERYAASTMAKEDYAIRHLNRYFEDTPLKEIAPHNIRTAYADMKVEDKLGVHMIKTASLVLHSILKLAVNDDILMYNPCERVERPQLPLETKRKALSKEEVGRLLQAFNANERALSRSREVDSILQLARISGARIVLATGMRRGEMLALTWGNIDLVHGHIEIRHTLQKDRTTKAPKSKAGLRTVSIDAGTIEQLRRWKSTQTEYYQQHGTEVGGSTPVVTDSNAEYSDPDNYGRWWRDFTTEHGFEGLKVHELRHTHATLLVSSGLNIKAVSARLGHASTGITLDLYAHAQREDDVKAAAIMGKVLEMKPLKMGKIVNF
ncbi:MAG: site-specific integrase [Coriobacteriia bacterium]|nr:site-specific integrase [Coriobacteriia bacterium]